MNRTLKIGLIVFGAVAVVGVGYYLYKRRKKDSPTTFSESIEKAEEQIIEEVKVDESKLTSDASYKELQDSLKRAYEVFDNTDYKMCSDGTAKIYNCNNKNEFSSGALQGSWILLMRRIKQITNEFNSKAKDTQVKEVGNKLISKLQEDTNKLFNPKFYNTNTSWYSAYIKKGGSPI